MGQEQSEMANPEEDLDYDYDKVSLLDTLLSNVKDQALLKNEV